MEKVYLDDWYIAFTRLSSTQHGINLFAVHKDYDLCIQIPNDDLQVFGFYVAGCELGIIGEYRIDNIPEQILTLRKIIDSHLANQNKEIDFWTIKDFINQEYKIKSKIEKTAIDRFFSIVKEEFQHLCKFKVKNNKEESDKIKRKNL